jgi:hypothetical protein
MIKINRIGLAVAAAFVLSLGMGTPADAGRCFKKASSGTGSSMDSAKFQAYEAILQSFDWGVWASYMASGSTPGYRVSPSYSCSKGGLGYNCRAVASICKTG